MDFDNPKVYDDTFISDGLVFSLKMVKKRLKCFTMVPVGLEGERGGVQKLSGKWPNRQGAFHKGTSLGC